MTPDQDIKEQIQTDISAHKIVLYMKGDRQSPQCGFSAQVVQILNQLTDSYETRNILLDDALRQGIKDFSDWPTIPQLYINGEFVGGCDIITELHQNNELQKILSPES